MATQFQTKVLELTKKIPKGKVTTYKEIAKALNSKAYQAIGTALKNNNKPIIIPCHRVINSDLTVGAYKGTNNSKEKIKMLKKEGIIIKEGKVKKNQIFTFSS